MRFMLRDSVTVTKKVPVKFRKGPLHAQRCDSCGKVFQMGGEVPIRGGNGCGTLVGMFSDSANDKDGRGLGNSFSSDVCSFACADKVMGGGWKVLKEYKPFAKIGAELVRCEGEIHSRLRTEQEILAT